MPKQLATAGVYNFTHIFSSTTDCATNSANIGLVVAKRDIKVCNGQVLVGGIKYT